MPHHRHPLPPRRPVPPSCPERASTTRSPAPGPLPRGTRAGAAAAAVRRAGIPALLVMVAGMLAAPAPAAAAARDPVLRDSAIALRQLASNAHYLSEELQDGLDEARRRRIREAYLRSLDPRGDLLLRTDADSLTTADVAAALREGRLEPVLALADRLTTRLADRATWINRWLATAAPPAPGPCADDVTATIAATATRQAPYQLAAAQTDLDTRWTCRLAGELEILRAEGLAAPDAAAALGDRYARLAARSASLDAREVTERFLNAFLAGLDPHSRVRLPATAPRVRGARRAPVDLFGIGAMLGISGDYVELQRLLQGGAAERSGLVNPGDRILGVADESGETTYVTGWAVEDVVELIRGPRGSHVTLSLLPRGAPPRSLPARVTLTRDQIRVERRKVTGELITWNDRRIGVLRVPAFYVNYGAVGRGATDPDSAASDAAAALVRLRREAPQLDAVLLDLRGNSGGALIEAVRMVGLFIDQGPVVRVRHAGGGVEVFEDEHAGRAWDGPLAVLVDRYSASASEIVAAALADYRRAIVIGEPTYGKGSVQEPFDLASESGPSSRARGRVSLTTAEFFRVNGETTQLAGVSPMLSLPVSLTNGRYGERFEYWPLPPERLPPSRYSAESGARDDVLADARAGMRSPALWAERPAYLRQAPPPPGAIDAWRDTADRERAAFRAAIGEQLVGELPADAPLPALWAQLIFEDALRALALLGPQQPEPVAGTAAAGSADNG